MTNILQMVDGRLHRLDTERCLPQKRSVYLAGPITGLTQEGASYGWRKELMDLLPEHIEGYSPMRATNFLKDIGVLTVANSTDHFMTTPAAIDCRDLNDVKMCDVLVACFLEAAEGYLSLGTAKEFGWAEILDKPIVMIAKEGDPHREHPMMFNSAGYVVDNLEDAAEVIHWLLTPGI